MADAYIGEIRMMGNVNGKAPGGWLICDGSTFPISQSQYQPLYSLIGTTYGGDGVSTFAVPDLRGRLPMGQGTGPGLTPRIMGQKFGSETVSLQPSNTPSHSHSLNASGAAANTTDAGSQVTFANGDTDVTQYLKGGLGTAGGTATSPAAVTIGAAGSGAPHNNIMPCATMNFIICYSGTYPTR